MSENLYFFKSAFRPGYRKENLEILSKPRQAEVESYYSFNWIPDALLEPDELLHRDVVIVFTDGPTWYFVPARRARITTVERGATSLTVGMKLGPFVYADDDADFAATLRHYYPTEIPPHRFVLQRRDVYPLRDCQSEPETLARWRTLIDGLCKVDRYAASVFLRFEGFEDSTGQDVDWDALSAGRTYRARVRGYNPHLGARLSSFQWDAFTESNLLLFHPEQAAIPADDVARLSFQPMRDREQTKATISVKPTLEMENTVLMMRVGVKETPPTPPVPPRETQPPAIPLPLVVRRVYDFAVSRYATSPDKALEFLQQCIMPILPDEEWPKEECGRLLNALGRHSEAVDAFQAVGSDKLRQDYKYTFLFSALLSRRDEFWDLSLAFDTAASLEELKSCLSRLRDDDFLRYMPYLLKNLAERTPEILHTLQECVRQPRSILHLSQFWSNEVKDPTGAERMLNRCIADGRLLETEETLGELVRLREAIPGNSNALVHAYNALVDLYLLNNRFDDAEELFRKMWQRLGGEGQWYRELEYSASRLAEAVVRRAEQDTVRQTSAFDIIMQLSKSACIDGNMSLASHYLDAAEDLAHFSRPSTALLEDVARARERLRRSAQRV